MTWCDKLASQPTVGFQLDPYYGGNETLLAKMAPLMATWGTPEKPEFTISVPDLFKLDVQRENGFLYSLDAQKASVQFQHRMEYKAVSGGLPVAQLISSPKVFTSLLADATEMLIEATLLLPEANSRHITRIGAVCTTTIAEDDLPPGIQKFIQYLGKPWDGKIEDIAMRLTSVVNEDDVYKDRCIHQIMKSSDSEQLLTLVFDWQRVLKKKMPIRRKDLERACEGTQKAALDYFEDLAVGNAFDAAT